jgi:hypothetical protein
MYDECEMFPTLKTAPLISKLHIRTVESEDADMSSLINNYRKDYLSSRDHDI